MTIPTVVLLAVPLGAPLSAAGLAAVAGWRRSTGVASVTSALVVLASGIALAVRVGHGHVQEAHILRADALTAFMLIVIGAVATLSNWASVHYLDDELTQRRSTPGAARIYAVLINVFIAAMTLAVLADNLGVVWVSVEATTIATAFLVGHRGGTNESR